MPLYFVSHLPKHTHSTCELLSSSQPTCLCSPQMSLVSFMTYSPLQLYPPAYTQD